MGTSARVVDSGASGSGPLGPFAGRSALSEFETRVSVPIRTPGSPGARGRDSRALGLSVSSARSHGCSCPPVSRAARPERCGRLTFTSIASGWRRSAGGLACQSWRSSDPSRPVTPEASSDIDVLVTFAPGESSGLGIVELQQSLEDLLGRSVDLLTRNSVERSANKYFRRFALRSTEPLYEAA